MRRSIMQHSPQHTEPVSPRSRRGRDSLSRSRIILPYEGRKTPFPTNPRCAAAHRCRRLALAPGVGFCRTPEPDRQTIRRHATVSRKDVLPIDCSARAYVARPTSVRRPPSRSMGPYPRYGRGDGPRMSSHGRVLNGYSGDGTTEHRQHATRSPRHWAVLPHESVAR